MCHNTRRGSFTAAALLAGALSIATADEPADETAQEDTLQVREMVVDDSLDRTPQDCIQTNRIRDTDVIDDRTIVFRMRGGDVFSNILERRCPGLGQHKRFMHETRGGRLCEIDTITVLEQWAGRITEGFTCGLGQFHPITEIEAQDLELGPDAVARGGDVEVREVELPPEDRGPDDDEDTGEDLR